MTENNKKALIAPFATVTIHETEKCGSTATDSTEINVFLSGLPRIRERYRKNRLAEAELLAAIIGSSRPIRENEQLWLEYCKVAPSEFTALGIGGRRPTPKDRQSIWPVLIHALAPTTDKDRKGDLRIARALQVLIDDGIPPEGIVQALKDRHWIQRLAAEHGARRRQKRVGTKNIGDRVRTISGPTAKELDQTTLTPTETPPRGICLVLSAISDMNNTMSNLRVGDWLYINVKAPSSANNTGTRFRGAFTARIDDIGK